MIKKIRIVGKIAVVTASADFHPLRRLKQLAHELEIIHFEGYVLFDLLAVNGFADNRFASIMFCENSFDRSSFALESNVNPEIISLQNTNAKLDRTFLLGSVLSSREIEEFMH